MNNPLLLDNLAHGIREISQSRIPDMENAIENYLERELQEVPLAESLALVEGLVRKFEGPEPQTRQEPKTEPTEATRLLSLLLGEGITDSDISSSEMSEKLAVSLNMVFDSLNRIISVIQSTLLGRKTEIETIRHVIGSQMGKKEGEASLQMYMNQIQHAFLTAHKAFQEAARSITEEMLSALNPESLASEKSSGLKFGPMRKAQLFESYTEKYQECRRWIESGRFTENLLREFEKQCQKTYQERT